MPEGLRRMMLHGTTEDTFDDALRFAGRLAAGSDTELHIVYTVGAPLSAGWTSEMAAARLPELHQAMDEEARVRIARVLPEVAQTATIVIGTDDPAVELVRYSVQHAIDLAIVSGHDGPARALLDDGRCSVLVLRSAGNS